MLNEIMSMSQLLKLFQNSKKEKLDYILEPLQAMLQLCFLSFCPIGTKLRINNNLLTIQLPGISQGFIRFMNDDNKDDLYYLFNVFRRFLQYYQFMESSDKHKPFYELILKRSSEGLDKLIQTYTDCNKVNIIHTLHMYKILLEKKDFFVSSSVSSGPAVTSSKGIQERCKSEPNLLDLDASSHSATVTTSEASKKKMISYLKKNQDDSNIDVIFHNIYKIYLEEEWEILHNLLKLCEKNPENYKNYIYSSDYIMSNTNSKIKKWITDNIAL